MPDDKVRTVDQPEGTGEYFSAGDLAFGISYARKLTDRFSIGFTAKYIQESIWHMSSSAFAIDAGTIFRTDLFGGMVIGASISNFGTSMKLSGIDTRTYEALILPSLEQPIRYLMLLIWIHGIFLYFSESVFLLMQ